MKTPFWRRHPSFITLGTLGLAAAVALFSFDWVLETLVHARPEVRVPSLQGQNVHQALETLAALKLGLSLESTEPSDHLPAGTIVRQKPLAGLSVREGKIVRVVMSQGGRVSAVPILEGKILAEAEGFLRSAGLTLGEVAYAYSIQADAGLVVRQNPIAGQVVRKGSSVSLQISQGAPPPGVRLMPNFLGQALRRGETWAHREGFLAVVQEETSSSSPRGTILQQSPQPDEALEPQTEIRFVVSGSKAPLPGETLVRYQVPSGKESIRLKLMLQDEEGTRVLYEGMQKPEAEVEVPAVPKGSARVRVFINEILVEEREL